MESSYLFIYLFERHALQLPLYYGIGVDLRSWYTMKFECFIWF
jgi:hypothetical protein